MNARTGFPVSTIFRIRSEARVASERAREKFALQERVDALAKQIYGDKASVALQRETDGWRAEVWTSYTGFGWCLHGAGADRSVVLREMVRSLESMVRGEARCRYCPRSIPEKYDGRRACIARPIASGTRRHPCVP